MVKRPNIFYVGLILLICLFATVVNRLPSGYIVSGSDFPYILDIKKHLKDVLYTWSNVGVGTGSPDRPNSVTFSYLFAYLLTLIGFSDTQILDIRFFNFIFLSALSCFFSLSFATDYKIRPITAFIASLFYAFNSFTLYGFTASWMYHPYFNIHITLPLIWVLFTKGIVEKRRDLLAGSVIVVLLSLSAFGNPAFLLTLFIFLGLNALLFCLLGITETRRLYVAAMTLFLYLSVLSFYLLPLGYEYLYGTGFGLKGNGGSIVDWIERVSSKIVYSIRLLNDNPQLFFPYNFPYGKHLKPFWLFLSIYPAFFSILPIILMNRKNKRWILVFYILLITFIYMTVKTNMPLMRNASMFIFTLPVLNGIRSPDKNYPFVVFIVTVLLFYFLREVSNESGTSQPTKFRRGIIASCLVVTLIYPLPFFLGKFLQNVTMDRGVSFSHLVKVPDNYKETAEFLARDVCYYKILHLPYSGVPNGYEATQWSYFPGWKFLGSDITRYYFENPVIHPTRPLGGFHYGKYLYQRPAEVSLLTEILGILGVRYVLFDMNAEFDHVSIYRKIFSRLKKDGLLKFEKKIGNIDIYKFKDETPPIHVAHSVVVMTDSTKSLPVLARTSYLNERNAVVFTDKLESDILLKVVNSTMPYKKFFFVNTPYTDFIMDVLKAEALTKRISSTPIVVRLADGKGSFRIKEKGIYEMWLRSADGQVASLKIADELHPVEKRSGTNQWTKIGIKRFKPGRYNISAVFKEEAKSTEPVLLIVQSEEKIRIERKIDSLRPRYLFYKETPLESDFNISRIIRKRMFYIPKDGKYRLSVLIRPRKEKLHAYTLDEVYGTGDLKGWDFRTKKEDIGRAKQRFRSTYAGIAKPVFLFGENFYRVATLSYPLSNGMWRWMSNDGKILLFNPFAKELLVNISLYLISFVEDRTVKFFLNNSPIKTVSIMGSEKELSKNFLSTVSKLSEASKACGKPKEVKINSIRLKPGLNELLVQAIPSATPLVGKSNYNISIAVRDDVRVDVADESSLTGPWVNREQFKVVIRDSGIVLKDRYKSQYNEIAWISKRFGKNGIDLFDTPLFILKYFWADDRVQSMDIGFRVDNDGDGIEDLYFVRTIPDSVSEINRFEIDLLREFWKIFQREASDRPRLVGVDLFPHKKWGLDVSWTLMEGDYTYQIKRLQLASRDAAIVVLNSDYDAFRELTSASDIANTDSAKASRDLRISLALGGRKGVYRHLEFVVPFRQKYLKEAQRVIFPFRVQNESVQNVNIWVGFDLNGDRKIDTYSPLGRKIRLTGWTLITKDLKEPMLLYKTSLPKDINTQYDTHGKMFRNIMITKDGKSLLPTWDNDFQINKEQVQVKNGEIIINLPREVDPDDYNYEFYYVPRDWLKMSTKFPDYKEYVIDILESNEYMTNKEARPIGLKFELTARFKGPIMKEKEFLFNFKPPNYVNTVLPELSRISLYKNIPAVILDGKVINLGRTDVDFKRNELRLEKTLKLTKGWHRLDVDESGALEAFLVELRPHDRPKYNYMTQNIRLSFKKINPCRYVVNIKNNTAPFVLVFSESFHRGWRAYVVEEIDNSGGKRVNGNRDTEVKEHFMVNGYANGWIINKPEAQELRIVIAYRPQKFFRIGLVISGAVLLGCISVIVCCKYRRQK